MTETPEAMVREAQRLQRHDRVPEAIAAYERVLARWPRLADCWFNLGILQRRARHLSAALASYQKALDLRISGPEEIHLNRSVIYTDYLRQHDAAERELKAALALKPSYVPALLNLANLYEDLDRRAEAVAVYERLLALDPRNFEGLARYANLQPTDGSDRRLLDQLRSALANPAASAAERASLGFALGRMLDGAGDYDAAFDVYAAANRDSRASAAPRVVRYDRRREEQRIDRLVASARVPPRRGAAVAPSPRPIFICGMFRSGSTLTEQLLAGHASVMAGGELDFLPRCAEVELAPFPESLTSVASERLESLAAQYLSEMACLFPDAVYVTDKRLGNFLYIGLIKSLFPTARIVHTTRDPLDTCLSIYFLHLDHQMSYALDLEGIAHHYRQYHRLMRHWRQVFGADIYDFDYDTFVHEPSVAAARLFAFLDLEWDDQLLARPRARQAIKTASVWQVREPLYERSSGRARHYGWQHVQLRKLLSDVMPEPPTAGRRQ